MGLLQHWSYQNKRAARNITLLVVILACASLSAVKTVIKFQGELQTLWLSMTKVKEKDNAGEQLSVPLDTQETTTEAPAGQTTASQLSISLPTPSGVTATTLSSTSIRVSWNAVSGAEGYNVYYGKAGASNPRQKLTVNGTSHDFTDLKSKSAYYYKVSAVNNTGEGMATSVISAQTITSNATAVATAQPETTQAPTSAGMVRIDRYDGLLGSHAKERNRRDDEGPQPYVTLTAFYMGKYEVTQKEYQEIMGTNPSRSKGDNLPVEQVSWYDAIEYCNKRSEIEGLTLAYSIDKNRVVTWNRYAGGYRLPTEAEWEVACTKQKVKKSQVNYNGGKTVPVGSYAPNFKGLYDMHGNVSEWCWDWYGSYSSGMQTDPAGAVSGNKRVLRGADFLSSEERFRPAYRLSSGPNSSSDKVGFRVARSDFLRTGIN